MEKAEALLLRLIQALDAQAAASRVSSRTRKYQAALRSAKAREETAAALQAARSYLRAQGHDVEEGEDDDSPYRAGRTERQRPAVWNR